MTFQSYLLKVFTHGQPRKNSLVAKEKYFSNCVENSEEFFRRFGNKVDFQAKTVLDVGCGYGATCFLIASKGAIKVVGVDIRRESIEFAHQKLDQHPELKGKLSFCLLDEFDEQAFDLIISKDSFEHYQNPEKFLSRIAKCLKPDGNILIGFSPFWKSPYGAHTASFIWLPWVHLIFSEATIIQALRKYLPDEKPTSYSDLATGLNKVTYKDFLNIIKVNNLKITYLKTNVAAKNKTKRILLALLQLISHIPPLKEYFTISVYTILTN
jgi:cyclopropane fatty-acyl-phospholipid synthase-like methyltransferase